MKEAEITIPQFFICPISLDLFKDPVTLCTGHTYDRSSIEQWLSHGNLTCPITMQKLTDLTMVPNHTLLHLIHQWLTHHLHFQSQSLEKIQSLSQDSIDFLPFLLEILFGQKPESETSQSLSLILKQEPMLESLSLLLEQGNTNIKEGLCYLVENPILLASLFRIVEEDPGISHLGIKAIHGLCMLESKRERLVQSGVLDVLLAYISSGENKEAQKAMEAIEVLLEEESAKRVVINSGKGIEGIVKMVFRVSDHEGSESAVKSLMIICRDSLKARRESIDRGVLTQLLLLMQSQCSGRAKTRATMLLKLLRSK